jgi:arginyl-tRNA synthetase
MLWEKLRSWLDEALPRWAKAQGIETIPPYALDEPPAGIVADVACNIALLLAKPLKKNPRALAQDLQKALEAEKPDFIQGMTIAGAGCSDAKRRLWQR